MISRKRLSISVAFFGCILAAAVWLVFAGTREEDCKPDVAVVLGNTVNPDGTPSTRLRARLDRAMNLYKARFVANIIVSGGTGVEGPNEADAMARYLIQNGVPRAAVFIDPKGNTTHDSAANSKALADAHGWTAVLVISQYFHLPRSRLAFARAGFARVCSSYARYNEGRDFYSTMREIVAFPTYFFRM